ncbi:MAG: DUF1570 domain-containing protein [Acidobacteriota bacterium]|nr:DUF1570 domain-containing protein [Acidobacteriota bacterium]
MKLLVGLSWLLVFCLLCTRAYGSSAASTWSVATSAHFSVYSQAGPENARTALKWFEELREFFARDGLLAEDSLHDDRVPVRVIGFRSPSEYAAFQLRKTADAYYLGTGSQDYIVLPGLEPSDFSLAAHEYTHVMLHTRHLQLPHWLNEGLAEFFSSVRIGEHGCEVGGEAPMRVETLRHHAWLPLAEVISLDARSPALESRKETAIFYAESWALTDLLLSSSTYAPRFRDFMAALNAGTETSKAITTVFRKNPEEVSRDLQTWVGQHRSTPVKRPGIESPRSEIKEVALSDVEADELLADLTMADGELDRAEASYLELARRIPSNTSVLAALGTIALRKGNDLRAEQLWRQAIQKGLKDANLCYEYAVLAEDRNSNRDEIRRALEFAVALRPDFDDARYKLALLESNAGYYQGALLQLRAMRSPSRQRAFGYWSATAYILTELDHREEAKQAADQALENATTAAERAHAEQLAYFAETDLTEESIRDADGKLRLVTKRVPHGTADFNPFIERGDQILRVEGTLREVHCGDGKMTGLSIETKGGSLDLAVPDPQHVLLRSGPAEFSCGPQRPRSIEVEYAVRKNSDGVLKAMDLR